MRLTVIIFLFTYLANSWNSQAQESYQLERLEPGNWWVGMKNPNLQLLAYGPNIADLNPSIDYPGVQVSAVHKVENPNYLFIDLHIDDNAQAGRFDIIFKQADKNVITQPYQLLARESGSANRQGFDNSDVLYLITPDRFANGNPKNDQVASLKESPNRENPGGRHGGDIAGVLKSLDYIKDLGYTAIWLNPVLENDQPEYSYHGYATTDFYKVDARYGSNEEYKALIQEAKSKGIKVIMDMILNHCGSEHWWLKDPPASNWFNNQGNFKPTNHKRTTIQDPYAAKIDYQEMVGGWFVKTMPDMNQRNAFMSTYLIQNTIWWIEYSGLAGIRMDTYPYPDPNFMAHWTCEVMAEYPNFNITGEEWSVNPAIVAHWQKGKVNPNGYTSCLPSVLDFPIQYSLVEALNQEETWGTGWIKLYEMLANDFLYADPYNLVIFPDNHDMSRFYTQVNEDFELYKLGMTYMFTTRGIPQIYYGTEILMKNPESDDHGIIRSDYPGGWDGDAINAFTGKGLSDKQKAAQAFTKKLLNWRKGAKVIHHGKMLHFAPENGVYVYFRFNEDQKVMVILNKNKEEQNIDVTRFAEILKGETKGKDVISGQEISLNNSFTAPARQAMILELD